MRHRDRPAKELHLATEHRGENEIDSWNEREDGAENKDRASRHPGQVYGEVRSCEQRNHTEDEHPEKDRSAAEDDDFGHLFQRQGRTAHKNDT